MVGETGFEPATPAPPAQCSTRLSYSPTEKRGAKATGFIAPCPLARKRLLRFLEMTCLVEALAKCF